MSGVGEEVAGEEEGIDLATEGGGDVGREEGVEDGVAVGLQMGGDGGWEGVEEGGGVVAEMTRES